MIRWEYHSTQIANIHCPSGVRAQDLVNQLGRDGWELIGFDVHNQAWFKRPLPDAAAVESTSERQNRA
jgi:hypothetical protein